MRIVELLGDVDGDGFVFYIINKKGQGTGGGGTLEGGFGFQFGEHQIGGGSVADVGESREDDGTLMRLGGVKHLDKQIGGRGVFQFVEGGGVFDGDFGSRLGGCVAQCLAGVFGIDLHQREDGVCADFRIVEHRDDGGDFRIAAAEFESFHDDAFGDIVNGGWNVLRESGRDGGAFGIRSRTGRILDERFQRERRLHDWLVVGFLQIGDEFLHAVFAKFLEFENNFLAICGIGPFEPGGQLHGALRGDGDCGAGG